MYECGGQKTSLEIDVNNEIYYIRRLRTMYLIDFWAKIGEVVRGIEDMKENKYKRKVFHLTLPAIKETIAKFMLRNVSKSAMENHWPEYSARTAKCKYLYSVCCVIAYTSSRARARARAKEVERWSERENEHMKSVKLNEIAKDRVQDIVLLFKSYCVD